MTRDANVILFREHKMCIADIRRQTRNSEEEGWTMLCSPCDDGKKKANAGVGIAAKAGPKITQKTIHAKMMKKAYEGGRADKCLVDLGWEQNLIVFNLYDKTRGRPEAVCVKEAIVDAMR